VDVCDDDGVLGTVGTTASTVPYPALLGQV